MFKEITETIYDKYYFTYLSVNNIIKDVLQNNKIGMLYFV